MPTTPAAIVDRCITVIEALSPTSLTETPFRVHRDEVEPIPYFEAKPTGAFRRFQAKDVAIELPLTSDALEQEQVATIQVTIAYPKTARYGEDQARDRKRVMREDLFKIEKAIGMLGAANFTEALGVAATWLQDGSGSDVVEGDACDFVVVTQRMAFVLDVS